MRSADDRYDGLHPARLEMELGKITARTVQALRAPVRPGGWPTSASSTAAHHTDLGIAPSRPFRFRGSRKAPDFRGERWLSRLSRLGEA